MICNHVIETNWLAVLALSVWCVMICLLTQRGTEAEGRVGGRQQGS